jgi:hypothetical protein
MAEFRKKTLMRKMMNIFFVLLLFIILAAQALSMTLNWSGYTWTIKSGANMGPGNFNILIKSFCQ